MSVPAEWLDPASGDPAPGSAEEAEARAERAARADAAVIAARAARSSLAASAAGVAAPPADLVADPTSAPVPEPLTEPVSEPRTEPVAEPGADHAAAEAVDRHPNLTLTAGIAGRMVLAFVTGCLAITLLPMLFGWHPYVVKSGSMEPRIKVGDVILASPNHNPQQLLGHVTSFDDPGNPGTVKSHRIIAINPDGTLTSKGDANPTPDPEHVKISEVHGIGRLLVRWAGLPMIWARNGQFLFLGLFLLVMLGSAWAVARDHDEDHDEDDDEDDDVADRGEGDEGSAEDAEPADSALGEAVAGPRTWRRQVTGLERRARSARTRRTVGLRALLALTGASVLLVPGAAAAFSATTRTTGSSWTVPAYSYTTTANSFSPYLYWKLGDTTATAADASGNGRTGTYAGTYTRSVTGATPDTSPNTAVTATTSTACINTTSTTAISAPTVFTEVVWFKTASGYAGGGKLIGFETPRTGVSVAGSGGTYDRHIYMDGAGKIWFGVYSTTYVAVSSPASYNDGSWHMAAATLSASGMALYVDGVLRASSSNTTAEATTGWWRVGCGNLSGWGAQWTGANNPGTNSATAVNVPFLGSLDEAAVYSGSALTAANISYLYWTR